MMDLSQLPWLLGAIVAALTIYNFVIAFGRRTGSTEEQLRRTAENETQLNTRFDALYGELHLYQSQTNERMADLLKQINETMVYMAREHATKGDLVAARKEMKEDLHLAKNEILDRIDAANPKRRSINTFTNSEQ